MALSIIAAVIALALTLANALLTRPELGADRGAAPVPATRIPPYAAAILLCSGHYPNITAAFPAQVFAAWASGAARLRVAAPDRLHGTSGLVVHRTAPTVPGELGEFLDAIVGAAGQEYRLSTPYESNEHWYRFRTRVRGRLRAEGLVGRAAGRRILKWFTVVVLVLTMWLIAVATGREERSHFTGVFIGIGILAFGALLMLTLRSSSAFLTGAGKAARREVRGLETWMRRRLQQGVRADDTDHLVRLLPYAPLVGLLHPWARLTADQLRRAGAHPQAQTITDTVQFFDELWRAGRLSNREPAADLRRRTVYGDLFHSRFPTKNSDASTTMS